MMSSQVYAYVPTKDDDESPFAEDVTIAEGLISRPDVNSLPTVAAQSMMKITAPATLPEGYELPVQLGSSQFKVKVPLGGIEQGQVFSVPIPAESVVQSTATATALSIPVGAWRDCECDCFNYGVCHPHIWTACCCSLLASGQVINRLKFTWTARPARNAAESARAFAILLYITIVHWTVIGITEVAIFTLYPKNLGSDAYVPNTEYGYTEPVEISGLLAVIMKINSILKWAYLVIVTFIAFSLRKSVRAKFGIPGSAFEDCCCAFWCNCCTVGQMLRHTTDYDVYVSQLCSPTGLSTKVDPMIV